MSQQNPIRLFVAHAWQETDDYHRIFEYLENARNFHYRNTSRLDPRPTGGVETEKDALRRQIGEAEIVIAPTALYRQDTDLMLFELEHARQNGKPVLLLKPFGVNSIVPRAVMEHADRVVEWNDREIIDTIRELARQESRDRYDTVDFSPDDFLEFKDFKITR